MAARLVGNLPTEVTSFVGRGRELAEVRRLLSAGRLVTMTGPGGVGKSRLARRVAGDVHRAFSDGVWLVEFADLGEADLVAVEVARALGLKSFGDATKSLADYLRDKNLLLLLDNCEHLIHPVVALLSSLLAAAPRLRVLATSRQVLGCDGEHLFEVPPLSLPAADTHAADHADYEAVTLFLDRAAAVLPELPAGESFQQSVIDLCRRLDGIPLAIELAAGRLRAYPVEELLARVERTLEVLTNGRTSAPVRHRTLRATIGWSFDLCSREEQLLWARLSVFSGGFDLRAVEGVCSDDRLPHGRMFDLLASLVDKSIVHRNCESASGQEARFSMLETVREYGGEQLDSLTEGKKFRLRHAQYFAALAERGLSDYFSKREAAWFQEVGLNRANLRQSLHSCLYELGEPWVALRIAAHLRMFWVSPGVILEGYQWLRKALANSPDPSAERAEALWVRAYIEVLLANTDTMAQTMAECRELVGELSLPRVGAALMLCVIWADFARGELTAALAHAKEAAALGRAVDDPTITGEALVYASSMAFALDDPSATALANEALTFAEAEGAQLWKGAALWVNGLVRCRAERLDGAIACFLDALAIFRRVGHELGVALCLDGLAWAAACAGELRWTARLLGAARPIWETGPHRMMPYVFTEVAVRGKLEAKVRAGIGDRAFDEEFLEKASWPLDRLLEKLYGTPARQGEDAERAVSSREDHATLTRREHKIAELLAEGMSNREIAAKLVISRRTVESHVQNILTKLGFHSRSQIASWIGRMSQTDSQNAEKPARHGGPATLADDDAAGSGQPEEATTERSGTKVSSELSNVDHALLCFA
jgi:predicted ATPase/DNA-binding CsgD family transcriptional regulator